MLNNQTQNKSILSEPLNETSGYCRDCRSVVLFKADKAQGYYKYCPACGRTEHLDRRPLKFDRNSRQWL
jgi:ribosomal protein L33